MKQYLKESEANTRRAYEIIEDLNMVTAWRSIGAEVRPVGSLAMGLMMKHRDIDFHIYTPTLDPAVDFGVMAQLAGHKSVKRIEYVNLSETDEACIEWHAWIEDADKNLWQADMIHILAGSRYDGYFEKMARRIVEVMTEEQRETILKLKYDTPDNEKIMGVEYYRAVIRDGVSTYPEFDRWRKDNPVDGIVEWIP
ncbi:MAG: phosphoglycerate mutase family protein [Rikenellaceae bacterium]|nr:phosphoglycerate mutase family protein [Rikenellaceae bacterium]